MDNNIWNVKEAEKICCFDIDGVLLSSYPQCWLDFVNKERMINFTDLNKLKLYLSYDEYRTLKKKYRTSGIKEFLPIDKYAKLVTDKLKEKGWKIIIMTARPAQEYPEVAKQTYGWLNSNGINYDYVIFGEKQKHVRVMEHFPNLKFAVEDNSYIANKMARTGCKVFLLNSKYNKGLKTLPNVKRIKSLKEVLTCLKI